MTETCVFHQIEVDGFNKPFFQGPNGECYAQLGKGMNECCFAAAHTLILLGQQAAVLEAVQNITRNSRSDKSRKAGINGALHTR